MSSSNSNKKVKSEFQEAEKNSEKNDTEDIILDHPLAIKRLYPSLSLDNKISKSLLLSNDEESTFQRNKPSSLMDEYENTNSISELFLQELVKKPCTLDKNDIIKVMTEFIQKSSLIKKFQKDVQIDKKVENNELSRMGATHLSYMELKKGQVLFRIGDNGDRFYFILRGRVSILKLKEINNVQMTYFEYLDYCMYLISQKENYIFNKVRSRNMKMIALNSETDVISIYKIFFMAKLKKAILGDKVPDIKSLMVYLKNYGFKIQDFNIKVSDIERIENNPNLAPEYKDDVWKDYLIKKCKPSISDLMLYEFYKSLFQDDRKKKPFTCFIYKPFLFLGTGLFFGDFALDSDVNKRNATIRAEEDTYLAYMKSSDYISIFAPKRRFEKMKEINFLYTNFFFGNISNNSFEKNYFHQFSPHEYIRNHELFDFTSSFRGLILLKEGKVSLEVRASIADLHDLIKYLWENITKNKYFKELSFLQKNLLISSSTENRIREYINEPIFTKLKSFEDKFLEEINKIKIFQIYIFTNKEIIGLEEYYLGLPYIMRAIVISNKINCYQIDKDNFENILTQEKQIIYQFVKSSVNKIISLIDRLQSLKINQIKMCKSKFEYEMSDLTEVAKTNSESINKKTIEINNFTDISMNNGINLQSPNLLKNKIYKSPVKSISTNLNPLIQIMDLKRKKILRTINNSNSNISIGKSTNFFSLPDGTNEAFLKRYNSYIFQKINESNENNVFTNEEIGSENNLSNIKINNTIINSNNSKINIKKRNKITLQLNSQRNVSYKKILKKFNNNLKIKQYSLSGLNPIEKMPKKVTLIKNNLSMMRHSPGKKKIIAYRNYYLNKKPLKNLFEKENTNEPKIDNIWLGLKTRELKKLKNISINDFIVKRNKDGSEKNSLSNNFDSNANNKVEDSKNKKIAITKAIKDFYNEIRSRGYSSFVKNKKANTILNRRKKRKYLCNCSLSVSSSVANLNKSEKHELKKISAKLPLIKSRNKNVFT